MNRLVEYMATVAIGLALVMFVVVPIVRATAQSITNSATLIQEASDGTL